jgi:hypothetical protein
MGADQPQRLLRELEAHFHPHLEPDFADADRRVQAGGRDGVRGKDVPPEQPIPK